MSIQLIQTLQLKKKNMSTMFLKVVLIAIFLQMTSSKEGCKRYFIKSNVGINGCDNKMSLEQEVYSVQCTEYYEKDPKVWISAV